MGGCAELEDGGEMEVRSGVELDWLAAGRNFSGSDVCWCWKTTQHYYTPKHYFITRRCHQGPITKALSLGAG